MAIQAKKQSVWPVLALLILASGLWLKDRLSESQDPSPPSSPMAHGWERIEGCRWVPHDRNDGDSFRVRFPDGRVEELRLFFVDAPESARRKYGGGRSNFKRISDQARDLGISDEDAVTIGKRAKQQVKEWLGQGDFTVLTKWDDPFGDKRYSVLIEMSDDRWLHESLVMEGLVRIHTKGTDLPDGTRVRDQEKHLSELEKEARRTGKGAWDL